MQETCRLRAGTAEQWSQAFLRERIAQYSAARGKGE